MKKAETNLLSLFLLLNRLALGLLFFFAGLRKLLPHKEVDWGSVDTFSEAVDAGRTLLTPSKIGDNWSGFASFVAGEAPLPEILGKFYGYALPPVETLAGLLLIIGLFSRISSTLIAMMLFSFIIAMGPDWWPGDGPAFSKNFILLALAMLLALLGSGRVAIKPDGPFR